MAREPRDVFLVSLEAIEGTFERAADLAEGLAMAWNDGFNLKTADRFQGRARLGERGVAAEKLGEDHAEAVFPERVAGNQDARLGRMEHHRVRVVSRRGDHLPVEPAHPQRVAIAKGVVVAEALGALVGDREDQRLLVPVIDERRLAFRNARSAAVFLLDGRIAAHMIGMAVRIDQAHELFSRKDSLEQRQRLRYVGTVT